MDVDDPQLPDRTGRPDARSALQPVGARSRYGPLRRVSRPGRLGAIAALAATLLVGCATTASHPDPVVVRIIAFNDFHGSLESGRQTATLPDPERSGKSVRVTTGGAAELAGLIRSLRATTPHSAVVSSGDLIGAAPLVSSLFRHESTIDAMNLAGVDLATLGNHEFDAGTTELQRVLRGGCAQPGGPAEATRSCALRGHHAGARFDTIVANVTDRHDRPLFAPTAVRTFGKVRVGFVGAVTRNTPQMVIASGVNGLRFSDEADAILRSARALRAEGVQAIVATIHEGAETGAPGRASDWNDPQCPGLRGRAVDIGRRIAPEVDLILTAHTHRGYDCRIDGRPFMQALSHGRGVSVADLPVDVITGRVDHSVIRSRNLPVFAGNTDALHRTAIIAAQPAPWGDALRNAEPFEPVARVVADYLALAAPIASREAGRITGTFTRGGRTDSAAGRLVADAHLAATRRPEHGGAVIALMNPGGIRTDLACRTTPPCPVSFGDLFAMQPFGNSLVVMTLSGAELTAILESQQPEGQETPLFLAPSEGLRYQWLSRAPAGQRVRDLRLDGVPVRPDAHYRVAVNSFLADGGDGFAGLRAGRDRVGGPQDLDALIDWLRTPRAPDALPRIRRVD